MLAAPLLLACLQERRRRTSWKAPCPRPRFTYQVNTTEFPVVVTFTSTSTDGFLYQWDFGDGSPLASGQTVTHTYHPRRHLQGGADYGRPRRHGHLAHANRDASPSPCANAAFSGADGLRRQRHPGRGRSRTQPGAIVRLSASGAVLFAARPRCPPASSTTSFRSPAPSRYSYEAAASTFRQRHLRHGPTRGNFEFRLQAQRQPGPDCAASAKVASLACPTRW